MRIPKKAKDAVYAVLDGYRFILESKEDEISNWRCSYNRRKRCKAKITTVNKKLFSPMPHHNHDAQQSGYLTAAPCVFMLDHHIPICVAKQDNCWMLDFSYVECLFVNSQHEYQVFPLIPRLFVCCYRLLLGHCAYKMCPCFAKHVSISFASYP